MIFHFNKKSLEDNTVPAWCLKFHGETYYVNHVDAKLPWSTKETPDNSHTKGSIKVKEVLLKIDDDNNATLTNLTIFDKIRLRNQKLGITRIIFKPHSEMHKALIANEFKHGPLKYISAPCSTTYLVCDLLDKSEFTFAALKYEGFRQLMPNESYYQQYDDVKGEHLKVDYRHPDTPYEYS